MYRYILISQVCSYYFYLLSDYVLAFVRCRSLRGNSNGDLYAVGLIILSQIISPTRSENVPRQNRTETRHRKTRVRPRVNDIYSRESGRLGQVRLGISTERFNRRRRKMRFFVYSRVRSDRARRRLSREYVRTGELSTTRTHVFGIGRRGKNYPAERPPRQEVGGSQRRREITHG